MTDKSVINAVLAQRPERDFAAQNAELISSGEVAPEQVCRTCIFASKRMHLVPTVEVLKAKRAKRDLEELKCHPDEAAEHRNVYSDAVVQPVNPDGSIPVRITKKTERVAAHVEVCGQKLAEKCRNCSRLVRQTVSIQGGVNGNGRPWFREVLIGGHCSIPAEGILVGEEVKFCDRKPMPSREQEQNCYTCGNNQTFGSVWMNEHGSVIQVDVTAYEMELARKSAAPDEIGLAIWAARQRKGQVLAPITPNSSRRSYAAPGLRRFIEADVLEAHTAFIDVVLHKAVTKRVYHGATPPANPTPSWVSAWVSYGRYLYGHNNPFMELVRMVGFAQAFTPVPTQEPYFDLVEVTPAVIERRNVITHYTVQFRGSGLKVKLDARSSDDTVGIVHALGNPTKVVIEITSPWHRRYGVTDGDLMSRRVLPKEPCPVCHGEVRNTKSTWFKLGCSRCSGMGKITPLPGKDRDVPVLDYLSDPECVARGRADAGSMAALTGFACTPQIPCYFHAKAPRLIETEEGVDRIFRRPEGSTSHASDDPERTVTMDNIADADVSLLKLRRRWLPQEAWRYFFEAEAKLVHVRGRSVNLAWAAFMTEEPWKPYCTLNMFDPAKGINFREAMGDWFGDPRAVQVTNPLLGRERPTGAGDSYYSWSKHMELEDWVRVTNPAERYTEELVRNDHLMRTARKGNPAFDRFGQAKEPFAMPEQVEVTQLPMHGTGGADMTTAEYIDWLNERVDVPIGDTGQTMTVSRRWLLYRYEMVGRSSANKKRRVTNANAEAELVKFNYDADDAASMSVIGFRCSVPEPHPATSDDPAPGVYTVDEINDPENPTCTYVTYHNAETDEIRICGAPLVWDEADREWEQGHMKMSGRPNPDEPYRRVGGPTMAGGPNSRRWLQDERLLRMGCEHWRPKPWIRVRQRSAPVLKRRGDPHQEIIAADHLVGKTIELIIDGERMNLVVGDDTQVISPLVQAIVTSHGSEEITYTGGKGNKVTAQIVSIS